MWLKARVTARYQTFCHNNQVSERKGKIGFFYVHILFYLHFYSSDRSCRRRSVILPEAQSSQRPVYFKHRLCRSSPGAADCCGLQSDDCHSACFGQSNSLATVGVVAVVEGARVLPWQLPQASVHEDRVSADLAPILLFFYFPRSALTPAPPLQAAMVTLPVLLS